MRAIVSGPTAIVRTLIAALPEERVRDLLVQFLLDGLASTAATPIEPPAPAPAKHQRAPRKVAKAKANGAARTDKPALSRKQREARREYSRRYAAKRRAERAAERARRSTPTIAATSKPSGRAGRPHKENSGATEPAVGPPVAITPQLFWDRAREREPTSPWRLVSREFDIKEIVARSCYARQSLPPGVGPMTVYKFLGLMPP